MRPEPKIKPHDVAHEILETTLLMSLLGGNGDDNRIGRMAKARMRFKTSGSVKEGGGDLTYDYAFPDGSKGHYELIHGTFSTRTGFQAAAFKKTLTDPDGEQHSSIKLVFPGTAKRSQFDDLNAFDTFFTKRIGSQIHNAKLWMETEVIPRIETVEHRDKPIEISGHCLGTQCAIWTKAFLERKTRAKEKYRNVTGVALLEPTAPGLVIPGITSAIEDNHDLNKHDAIQHLYHNAYSVFVDPPTVVTPFGHGNMWDTVPIGEQDFTIHMPPTKLSEELAKARENPFMFRRELQEKERDVLKDLAVKRAQEEEKRSKRLAAGNENVQPLPPPKKLSTFERIKKAFFKTAVGMEFEKQYFKNHYLLALSEELLPEKPTPDNLTPKPKKPIEELITETLPPDAAAMLAHRAPNMGWSEEQRINQLLTAVTVDHGRDLVEIVTRPCVRGGRRGVPGIEEERPWLWNDPFPTTMDDTLEKPAPNYPAPFYERASKSYLADMLTATMILQARLNSESEIGQRITKALEHAMQPLNLASLTSFKATGDTLIAEIPARKIARSLPSLRSTVEECAKLVPEEGRACVAAIATIDAASFALGRGYNIKPEHNMKARYR